MLGVKQEELEKSTLDETESLLMIKTEGTDHGNHLKPAIIESGPVQIDNTFEEVDNDTECEEGEAEEEHVSASQLLGFGNADDGK